MGMTIFNRQNIDDLNNLLIKDGLIVPVPAVELAKFNPQQIMQFCVENGVYQLPTTELIDFLKAEIGDSRTIEIGAGNGCIGRNVGVKMTDNRLQDDPTIAKLYASIQQPTVTYGKDVEKIDAIKAVKKYYPKTVLACWVTHLWKPGMPEGNVFGVEEELIFRNGVKKYIHVGNNEIHKLKPILKKVPFRIVQEQWLYSRASVPESNVIYIFEK